MGKLKDILLCVALIAVILSLASITQGGQASGQMQTVPTVGPTETEPPGSPTRTPVPIRPTRTQVKATPTNQSDVGAATQQPGQPTNTPHDVTETEATDSIIEDGTPLPSATSQPAVEPTQNGINPATLDYVKIVYFLVCGLGVVVAIVIILLLAIRKAGIPPAKGSGQ